MTKGFGVASLAGALAVVLWVRHDNLARLWPGLGYELDDKLAFDPCVGCIPVSGLHLCLGAARVQAACGFFV
jgi:hypothetical protein